MTSFMHFSYHPIAKRPHMDQTILDPLLTLSEEKKNTRLKGLLIIDTSAGLEPFNTSSNGRATPRLITLGNLLTRSMLHRLLTPITDKIPSPIKGLKGGPKKSIHFLSIPQTCWTVASLSTTAMNWEYCLSHQSQLEKNESR